MPKAKRSLDTDDTATKLARIRRTTIFEDLPPRACADLAAIAHFRALAKGTVLWKQGSHAFELALVWEGALGVVREGDARVGYRIVQQNQTIGFSNAIGRIPCSVDVVAHEDSRILLFPGDALRALVPVHPEIAFRTIAYLGELVASLSDEIERLHTGTLEDRILSRLEALGKDRKEIVITHAELASQVAARRESVTRALSVLEKRGVIRLGRGRIRVER